MSLFDRHLDFVAALRRAGLPVSVAEDIDAAKALGVIDMADRPQLRAAYAAAVVKRPMHRPAFDTVFDLYFPEVWSDTASGADEPAERIEPGQRVYPSDPNLIEFRDQLREQLLAGDTDALARLARIGVGRFGAVAGGAPGVQSWSAYITMARTSPETLLAALLTQSLEPGERGTMAERLMRQTFAARIAQFRQLVDTEVQRRMAAETGPERVARTAVRPSADRLDLLHATNADLSAIRREIQPLGRRLAARLAHDHRHGRRGKLDFRRTIRASLSSGGVPMQTYMRPRHPRKTDLVILCDVSDSVTSFARFTLMLIFALREQFNRVRVFAFVDDLDEVTRFFRPGVDITDAIAHLDADAQVRGWYGRTDYGRAFRLFEENHADAITSRSSLLVLGDARSNYGDPNIAGLQRMVGRARRAYWLNPERRGAWDTGDSCASQVARVMPMVECRNLAQLGDFVRDVV